VILLKFKIEDNLTTLLIAIIAVWIILAVIFALYDLEISKALINRESIWAHLNEDYGEHPGYAIIAVAIAISIGSFQEDLKKQKIAAYVIIMIGIFFLFLGLIFLSIWFIVFGACVSIGVFLFLIFTFNRDWREFKKIAIVIILLAVINPLIFVQICKIFWGRVRFNDLNPNYSNYTPWYLPNGPDFANLYKNASFPSGHAAMGWMFLPLLIVIKDRKFNDPIRIIVTMLVISWGILVAILRIISGDHYASDVLFSTGVAAVAMILLYIRFYKEN